MPEFRSWLRPPTLPSRTKPPLPSALPTTEPPALSETREPRGRPRLAVILAAGYGSRLCRDHLDPPKPLTELSGLSLVERAMRSCRAAAIDKVLVVVGHRADEVRTHVLSRGPALGLDVQVVDALHWERGNGASVLACEPYVGASFFLMMADHITPPAFLKRLLAWDDGSQPCALLVDRDLQAVRDLEDATKVRSRGRRIVTIGKAIEPWDAVDTGVFLCRRPLFGALRQAAQRGDGSLSAGVQILADRGQAFWVPRDGGFWQDIDTPADLEFARAHLGDVNDRVPLPLPLPLALPLPLPLPMPTPMAAPTAAAAAAIAPATGRPA